MSNFLQITDAHTDKKLLININHIIDILENPFDKRAVITLVSRKIDCLESFHDIKYNLSLVSAIV